MDAPELEREMLRGGFTQGPRLVDHVGAEIDVCVEAADGGMAVIGMVLPV